MFGLGTLINTGCILAGGLLGFFAGKLLKDRHRDTLTSMCGVSTLFIGIAGAMEGMLKIENSAVISRHAMLVVLCLVLGGLIGEILNIEKWFERFGEWLKRKTGNGDDNRFVNGFVTTSLIVCIGAMAVVGSLQDGISGNWVILATKGVLDFIIVMVMTGSFGKGCVFSAIPVFLIEGSITVLGALLKQALTDTAVAYLSMVGSILIFCVGLNLIRDKKIRVANLLPAVVLAAAAAYIPVSFL